MLWENEKMRQTEKPAGHRECTTGFRVCRNEKRDRSLSAVSFVLPERITEFP